MSNHPTRGNLLSSHVHFLTDLDHELLYWITDSHGCFAAKMRDHFSKLPFIVSSRGVPPYRGIVSFQTYLLETWKTLHLLGIQTVADPEPVFYLYSGRRISHHTQNVFKSEYKPGCIFVNFPFRWGEIWDPKESLDPVWEIVKSKTPAIQSTF